MADFDQFMLVKNIDRNEPTVTCLLSEFDQLRKDSQILQKIRKTMFAIEVKTTEVYQEPLSRGYGGGHSYVQADPKVQNDVLVEVKRLVNE